MTDNDPGDDQDVASRAVRRLNSASAATFARVDRLRERAMDAVREKQESLDAGDAVPHDKRPI